MVIKTKYSLSHMVWVMHENKPTEYQVFSIEPTVRRTNDGSSVTSIGYRFEDRGYLYCESEVFASKEALIQSL